jgi:hypothetical protein
MSQMVRKQVHVEPKREELPRPCSPATCPSATTAPGGGSGRETIHG